MNATTPARQPNVSAHTAPSASPLDAVVQQIRDAFSSGDIALTLQLVNENLLETWFGTSPDEVQQIVSVAQQAELPLPPLLLTIRELINAGQANGAIPASGDPLVPNLPPSPGPEKYVAIAGTAMGLRLHGRPVEALALDRENAAEHSSLQTLFATLGALELFRVLQHGLTAMLAGDFIQADAMFAQARLLPSLATLPFLARDAHSKSAVLQACFGDPAIAAAHLAIADEQPRTNSWIEPVLDAQSQLARALIVESPEEAIGLLESIPLSTLGEMWPFYAYALHAVFERAGQATEALRRLEVLDQTRLPRVDRQGFSGSVIPSLLAFSALSSGNPVRAKELWKRVDDNLAVNRLGSAVFLLANGDARGALRIAMDVRSDTRHFRQLEIWRLSLLAAAMLLLEDEQGCLEVLGLAMRLPRGLSSMETGAFHESVLRFAREHIDDWPAAVEGSIESFTQLPLDIHECLTSRELEVLQALARGLTREQIARELYLSANTVKVHLQTLYRKLGVKRRNAAVIEGERRGLI